MACFLSSARAQYVIDSWTTDNGLPQNSVVSIQQTPDGYLWFTTFDGLVRFDGVRFTVFNKGNSPGLTSNRLTGLLVEQDGTFWVHTETGGLLRFRAGRFQALTMPGGLPMGGIVRIQRDIDGSYLLDTTSGISHLRDGRITSDPPPSDYREHRVYVSPRGARWEVDSTGLRMTIKGRESRYPLPPLGASFRNFRGLMMHETPDGVLWIGLSNMLYRLAEGVYTTYTAKADMSGIMHDREGHIWFGTRLDGVCRFADDRFTCYTTTDGLSSNSVSSVFQDREGTMWAGTSDRGLNRLTRRVVTPRSTAAGLRYTNVYPILEDRAGDVWLGSPEGLARMRDGRVTEFFGESQGLQYNSARCLYEDRAGRLWIGGVRGIRYYANGRFVDFTANLKLEAGNYYSCFIHEDATGALWVGSSGGLQRYQFGQVRRYTVADGLPSDDVRVGHWARDGTLWVGTLGGLARLEGERFVPYTERDGLAGNHVRAIHEDDQGTLWIGTYDGGLSRLRDGKFVNYTTAQGLFSNGVFMILEDQRGNFWMSSNQGIHRVGRQQLEDFAAGRIPAVVSTGFGKSDGMLSIECNGGTQPAGFQSRDGKLWFPTQDGAAVIDPEALPYNPLQPPVVIESAQAQGRNLPLTGELRLKPNDTNLEIRYTGLSFIKPEQVRFRYRLEALDHEWVDAGTRRTAFYPYLPPGTYTFHVIAANSDLVWNEEGAALKIVVLPPFYRTWWFLTLAGLSAAGAAGLTWRRRVSQLERANASQQAFSRQLIQFQEGERKRMAAELHDSLGQHLLIIKNRADLGLRATDGQSRAKEQLDEIAASASQAIDEVRHIAYNLRPLNLERLGLTAVIEEMIEEVATASGIQFSTDVTPIDGCLSPDDAINLYRIVQESLNNIVRHAKASKANVEIWREGGGLHVTIADNGRGLSPESPARRGLGLTSIAERVRMLGGTHTIVSAPGKGTALTIHLPVRDAACHPAKGAADGV